MNEKQKTELKGFLNEIFEKYKTGFFLCEINNITSYVYNDYGKKELTIMFSSEDLTIADIKEYFEERGRNITKESDSERGMALEIAMIEGNDKFKMTSSEIYAVKEAQLTPMNKLMQEFKEQGLAEEITPINENKQKIKLKV